MTVSREEFRKLKPVTIEDDERLIKEENKENAKRQQAQYYEENKDEIKEQQKQYAKEHVDERKEYMKGYQKENKEELKEYLQNWNEENKEKMKEYRRENKEELKLKHGEYLKTEKGKFTMKKFRSKRRGLGFLELNEPSKGSVAHHFNKEGIIHIPVELHRSISHNVFTGKDMNEINRLAFDWLESIELSMPMESWMR